MMRKVIDKDGKNWDTLLPYLMFAIREVHQSLSGFSPFQLLYGRQPRGILDIAKEMWEEQTPGGRNMVEHVMIMAERIKKVMPIVKDHMEKTQLQEFFPCYLT